jgi:sensor c-di-GMP phosphodiesterase-like protein
MSELEKILIGIVATLVLSGAFAAWWAYHNHAEQAIGAQACIQNTTVTKETAAAEVNKNLADYQNNQAKPAEAQHEQDIAAIDLRVIHTPFLVHDGALCPSPVSSASAKTSADSAATGAGGTLGGTGSVDIRPALEAFKAKLESIVADDRREDAEWPKPKETP